MGTRDRLRLVGGPLRIDSDATGTRVEAKVPLPSPGGESSG